MREHDNTALVKASENHDEVIPFYVIDDDYFENATLGYPRVKFWHDSLTELKQILRDQDDKKLVIRQGKPLEKLQELVEETDADKLYYNRDYSPYARKRDGKIEEELDIETESFKDIVLHEKKEILTNSDTPYKVYTYYKKKWFNRTKPRPQEPEEYTVPDLETDDIPTIRQLGFRKSEDMEVWEGGRQKGKEWLEDFREKIWNYGEKRDLASKDATSKLSPHLKFGTVSIRESFWMAERLKARNMNSDTTGIKTWQEELAWRDFYFQLLWNFPETTEEPMQEEFKKLDWNSKEEAEGYWNVLINGKTGYPFVDAGMRQLKQTGWMHNRLRMVVTCFACKDLWLDWKDLHEYYKKMFVDAEVASMVGGIQWAYSIGTDAQPYFRVFNPWKQGEDYDPDGEYIRKYVDELEKVPDKYIHRPHKMPKEVQEEVGVVIGEDYPEPIVDHDEKRKESVEKFENAKED
jgi:deoxyribodipyrimidine photo-lyase